MTSARCTPWLQRFLAVAPTCCQPEVGVYVETESHELERYVGAAATVCLSLDIPAHLVRPAGPVLEPRLAPDDLPMPRRDDGGVRLATTLTVEMAAALRELPPMNAHVYPTGPSRCQARWLTRSSRW